MESSSLQIWIVCQSRWARMWCFNVWVSHNFITNAQNEQLKVTYLLVHSLLAHRSEIFISLSSLCMVSQGLNRSVWQVGCLAAVFGKEFTFKLIWVVGWWQFLTDCGHSLLLEAILRSLHMIPPISAAENFSCIECPSHFKTDFFCHQPETALLKDSCS